MIAELSEVRPTSLPSVPRLFEKVHAVIFAHHDAAKLTAATEVGVRVRTLRAAGEEVPAELQAAFDAAEEAVFRNVRAVFGGNLHQAITGAAPIAPEILEFFYACGVPVLEAYGLTETATAACYSTATDFRFGSVGRPLPGLEARIAGDGELLLKGPNIFGGYWGQAAGDYGAVVDGWLHTGDLAHIDEDGYIYITGRKKDLIITAGGKNLSPANFENAVKRNPLVADAVMFGDRRPYPVALITLDGEQLTAWAARHPDVPAPLAEAPAVRALVQAAVDEANAGLSRPAQVKRFAILGNEFSQATGELTPTLKVRRAAVAEKYAGVLDALYGD
jgi:long-chain acyl-CoA synthetase